MRSKKIIELFSRMKSKRTSAVCLAPAERVPFVLHPRKRFRHHLNIQILKFDMCSFIFCTENAQICEAQSNFFLINKEEQLVIGVKHFEALANGRRFAIGAQIEAA